jgi:hypothetical protein
VVKSTRTVPPVDKISARTTLLEILQTDGLEEDPIEGRRVLERFLGNQTETRERFRRGGNMEKVAEKTVLIDATEELLEEKGWRRRPES